MSNKQKNKVLISFLGTGPFQSKEQRIYKTANYHLGENDLGQYPFVSAAIKKHYGINKVLLVGTVHSMWEEVYRWFSEDSGQPVDLNIYSELGDACEKANHLSPLLLPHQEAVEQAIGTGSRVVLVKYGVNDNELRENIDIILGLHNMLEDGDELIVDVTHSFRSLPIFMMNLIVYLQNVSPKRIKISHIHYGMLEMIGELKYAPILDLIPMLEVNEWITGAYNFKEYGNAYDIASLLNKDSSGDYKDTASTLVAFSEMNNLNNLREYRQSMHSLTELANHSRLPAMGIAVIPDVVREFIDRFGTQEDEDRFRLKMARWHYKRKSYALAFVNLVEAVKSYCCSLMSLSCDSKNNLTAVGHALTFESDKCYDDMSVKERRLKQVHDKLVMVLTGYKIPVKIFLTKYRAINTDRNRIAHDLFVRDCKAELEDLKEALAFFGKLIHERIINPEISSSPKVSVCELIAEMTMDTADLLQDTPTTQPLFINFSNHPSGLWGEEQMNMAQLFGEVVDLPYPQVPPEASVGYIRQLSSECVSRIWKIANGRPLTVHIMGEMNLCYAVVNLLKQRGVRCVASTTERRVTEADGKKTSEFRFVQFRDY